MKLFLPTAILLTVVSAASASDGGDKNLFAGTLAQSLAAVLVFFVLLAILYKLAWGPILKGLQDRENKIKNDLAEAQNAAQEAANTLKQYQDKLAQAQAQARQIIERTQAEAQKLADRAKEETLGEIAVLKKKAEADIRFAKEQALVEIYNQSALVATQIASQLLHREIRAEDQQNLIKEALAAIKKQDLN